MKVHFFKSILWTFCIFGYVNEPCVEIWRCFWLFHAAGGDGSRSLAGATTARARAQEQQQQ
jgi:hypothetical protein